MQAGTCWCWHPLVQTIATFDVQNFYASFDSGTGADDPTVACHQAVKPWVKRAHSHRQLSQRALSHSDPLPVSSMRKVRDHTGELPPCDPPPGLFLEVYGRWVFGTLED